VNGGHALALGVERDLVDARVAFIEVLPVDPGLEGRCNEAGFGRVADGLPGLPVEPGVVVEGPDGEEEFKAIARGR